MKKYLILALSSTLIACSSTRQPNITNYETTGNLKSYKPISDCMGTKEITNQHSPADLYPAIKICVKNGNYEQAVDYFAFAGVYGRFDTQRVSDTTAHQAVAVLKLDTFNSLNPEEMKKLQSNVVSDFAVGSARLKSICAALRAAGAPTYYPSYMIQHGMGAFMGKSTIPIIENFDAKKAWELSLNSYLHCDQ